MIFLKGGFGAAIEVHRYLGPDLLESTYQQCLGRELEAQWLPYMKRAPVDHGFLIDFNVDVLKHGMKSFSLLKKLHELHGGSYNS